MSKKNRKNKRNTAQPKSQRSWLLWAGAVAVIFVIGGLGLLLISGGTGRENGTPKLVVDQTVIDEGYQKLDKTIRTSFTLRNEGDATLRIEGEPQVKLVEGC